MENETANLKLIKLFEGYLQAKAEYYKTLGRLWETDTEKYGADAEAILIQKGIAEGYEYALRDFRQFVLDKNN